MATYTVHVPFENSSVTRRADRTIFVREGFSLSAFLFGPLYLIYRGLWLAALGWVALAAGLAFLAHAIGMPPLGRVVLFGLLALLTGFEASTLRQISLGRQGYGFAALLAGLPLDQAERAFFHGDGTRGPAPRPSASQGRPEAGQPTAIIGLFPDAREP